MTSSSPIRGTDTEDEVGPCRCWWIEEVVDNPLVSRFGLVAYKPFFRRVMIAEAVAAKIPVDRKLRATERSGEERRGEERREEKRRGGDGRSIDCPVLSFTQHWLTLHYYCSGGGMLSVCLTKLSVGSVKSSIIESM